MRKLCEICDTWHEERQAHDFTAATRNQSVTIKPTKTIPPLVTCNQCVTKDDEIIKLATRVLEMSRVIDELEKAAAKTKPKRQRAEYMKKYRKKK